MQQERQVKAPHAEMGWTLDNLRRNPLWLDRLLAH